MRKLLFILFMMSSVCLSLTAQESDNRIRQKMSQATSAMNTMQCDFVQTKHIRMLNREMVSKGKMYYQKTACLRWEYVTPYTYTFILNHDKVVLKNSRRKDVIDVKQNKVFSEIAQIMMSSVVGDCLTDDKNFSSTITVSGAEWVVALKPKRREVRQMFSGITLHFSQKTALVTKVEITEKSGDKTVITLTNIRSNEKISADMFSIH